MLRMPQRETKGFLSDHERGELRVSGGAIFLAINGRLWSGY